MVTNLGRGLGVAVVGWMTSQLSAASRLCSYQTHYGNVTTVRYFRCDEAESCCRRTCCGGNSPPDLTRVWFFWLTVIMPVCFLCICCGFNMRKRALRMSRIQAMQPNIINVTNVQGFGQGAPTNTTTQTPPAAGGQSVNPSGTDIFLASGAAKPMQPAYAVPGLVRDD